MSDLPRTDDLDRETAKERCAAIEERSAGPSGGNVSNPVPKVVSSEALYSGKVVSMRVDTIAMPDGGLAVREVVEHPGAVVIAALDGEGRVFLVSQYRHPVGRYLLELPAGGLEEGETPLEAAKRELREEVGVRARLWLSLGTFFSSPGFVNERLHAFLAQGLETVDSDPDDDEDLSVVRYPLADLLAEPDRIADAKTLATLLLLSRRLRESPSKTT